MSAYQATLLAGAVEHLTQAKKALAAYRDRTPDASDIVGEWIANLEDLSDVVDQAYGEESLGIGDEQQEQ